MRLIGLTGGIGSGKTTVSNYLTTTYRLPIWDADLYAREAVEPGSPVLKQIVDRYGRDILLYNGNLNRQKLASLIFSDSSERTWLEQQIHPFVRHCFVNNIKQLKAQKIQNPDGNPYADGVLVIPLLFESQMTDLVTEIWVVYCPLEQQYLRLIEREKINFGRLLTTEEAEAKINSQMSLAEKCKQADIILYNSSTPAELFKQVDAAIRGQNIP
ncbi:dephospho-CoA kinase [Planktothrix agardhii]|jgi:dephospho-CoA kinase|uniref:Dephospho-CoA kinase n=2 Tax=Planktothrix agardhii TaxID=1160 RepID=A0A073CLZ5_PLAA1|nr:dephospho-CoA kinase [Planktothrix agardhii]MCF3605485.1 dephospho-CoA kinase [Planktothrix agardhii 1033]BBD53790.1 dephospho-CoA kinase [Planktothrix agardhii NIES-204]KEI68917.1 CoaE [Planktothrix agardhii NIVA-CYA 126/8]MBG0745648.1 dephospho-CoA kinase [Planktothrix agardhii KL2]MCB8749493.1 dephospho-CoA kinase [Planktothrix agardhii 1810]